MYKEQTDLKDRTEFIETAVSGEFAPACAEATKPEEGFESNSAAPSASLSTGTPPGPCSGSDLEAKSKYDWLSNRVAIATLTLACWLPYMAFCFMTSHFYYLLSGIQTTQFMHATNHASAIGVVVTSFCSLELARAFLGIAHTKFSILCRVMLTGFALWVGWQNGFMGLAAALSMIACGFAMIPFGGFLRQAIPATFRFRKALRLMALASAPAALFVAFGIGTAIAHPNPPGYYSTYSDSTTGAFLFMTGMLYILLAIPSYAAARCARTTEIKPLITLGLLLQTPLFIGMFAQLAILAFLPGNATMVVAGLAPMLLSTLFIAAGAALAARVNKLRHKRLIAKTGN